MRRIRPRPEIDIVVLEEHGRVAVPVAHRDPWRSRPQRPLDQVGRDPDPFAVDEAADFFEDLDGLELLDGDARAPQHLHGRKMDELEVVA